jgi:UDP-2-acetamido-3-amino-2,3-dideoxy-glucuronate N-acetyltransferase
MERIVPRIAVLGCGYWGKNLVRNFHDLGSLELVCDVAEEGCLKAKELAPNVRCSQTFETAFEDPTIDGVVLATPAETHESLTVAALKAGKHVYVEKPMALNVGQGIRMQAYASESKRILMVGHILEFHPAVLRLRELIRDDILGKVRYIYSNRLNFGKIRTEENSLWSFAPHDIAVILRLFDDSPIEVTSVGGSYVTSGLADVTVSCLRFKSGQRAHVFVSWLNPFKEQKLVVVGEKKMAVFNDMSIDQKLVLYDQSVGIEDELPVLRKGETEIIELPKVEPLREECRHFLDCIRNGETPLTDGSSGVSVLRVLEACQQSLECSGVPVQLDEKKFKA